MHRPEVCPRSAAAGEDLQDVSGGIRHPVGEQRQEIQDPHHAVEVEVADIDQLFVAGLLRRDRDDASAGDVPEVQLPGSWPAGAVSTTRATPEPGPAGS